MYLPLAHSLSPLGRASKGADPINVASQANGGVASASSTVNASFPASGANNGNRSTLPGWGAGGGWNDATNGVWPDWLQIDFNGSKTINRVVIVTLRTDFANTSEPTSATSASAYGIKDFLIQYWDSSQWATLTTVTGNALALREFTFAPVTTAKIQLYVTASNDGAYCRVIELEAWGN